MDPAVLTAIVTRFNGSALDGRDADFGRGESAYGKCFSDPTAQAWGLPPGIAYNPAFGIKERRCEFSTRR
jgi:hypothetical protein